jgi:hypothetical protein
MIILPILPTVSIRDHDYFHVTQKTSIRNIKLELGSSASAFPYLPSTGLVQGSGSSYCGFFGGFGTLGVRVDRTPNTGFFYIATYHNFEENDTQFSDFLWVYNANGIITAGLRGTVIDRIYLPGPPPFLDCALIQLSTQSASQITSGLLQGSDLHTSPPPLLVKGTGSATAGTVVTKYGMTTGLTYGLIINLPTTLSSFYAKYLFGVVLCDNHGFPMPGDFAQQGDSGAPVVNQFRYVLGLIVQVMSIGSPGITVALVNRIDQVIAVLKVQVHTD